MSCRTVRQTDEDDQRQCVPEMPCENTSGKHGSFREWATGLTSYGGESFGRIGLLFILLAGQYGPREGIVYGKQIKEAGNDGE